MHQWNTGNIPDPTTDQGRRQLRRVADSLNDTWDTISEKFKVNGDGKHRNARLEKERGRATTAHSKAVERAKKGADARWNKDSPKESSKQCSSNSNQNQNQNQKQKKHSNGSASAETVRELFGGIFDLDKRARIA
jgi:uncharacterized protein YdaU (DUF1376 family)